MNHQYTPLNILNVTSFLYEKKAIKEYTKFKKFNLVNPYLCSYQLSNNSSKSVSSCKCSTK